MRLAGAVLHVIDILRGQPIYQGDAKSVSISRAP
jgi:hypothetical protein